MENKLNMQTVRETLQQLNMHHCEHCEHNPEATAPFSKMLKLPIGDSLKKVIAKVSKDTDVPEACYVCYALARFPKLCTEASTQLSV